MSSIVYAKNMAGDILHLYHKFENESEWDLRKKINKILDIDDPWRVCILKIHKEIDQYFVSYIILDKLDIDIKLEYIMCFIDAMGHNIEKYRFYINCDDDNYDYDVYYDVNDEIFYSIFESKFKDIKSLFRQLIFPKMYMEKIAHISNDLWISHFYS